MPLKQIPNIKNIWTRYNPRPNKIELPLKQKGLSKKNRVVTHQSVKRPIHHFVPAIILLEYDALPILFRDPKFQTIRLGTPPPQRYGQRYKTTLKNGKYEMIWSKDLLGDKKVPHIFIHQII